MTPSTLLAAITRQVGRLRPDWRNHERYFEERSEIERALRALVHELKKGEPNG